MSKNYKTLLSGGTRALRFALAGALLLGAGVQANAQTYCTPLYSSACTYGDDIKDVIVNGASGTLISNLNTPCPTGGYQDYTASTAANMTVSLIQNSTYTGNVTTNYSCCEDVRAWIDYNNNGTFEASEQLFTPLINIGSSSTGAFSFTVPLTASAGVRRMRVRLGYYGTATMDPCNTVSYGECHDYKVTIMPLAPPNNAGIGSLVSPASNTPFCSNTMQEVAVSVVNLGNNALTTANIHWSLDGVMQPSLTLPVALPNYKDSVTVVLGQVLFPTTAPRTVKAWTSLPNNLADTDHSDDTLTKSPAATLQGVDVHVSPNDTIICDGSSITLDAGEHPLNPFYVWNNGSLEQTRSVNQSGTYIVKVQNNIGCYDMDTVVVQVHPHPIINSIAIIDNSDGSFTFNVIGAQHIFNYSWNFDDGTAEQPGTGTPTQLIHSFADCGEYNVTLTLSNDCST
ncbi:MAG: PKD domain-containing protein, partial [Sphingobacteriales bacterium]